MRAAYLTFDDSASARMDDLVSWLEEKGVPALFYCRGDRLEEHRDAAIRAVEKGFILANHTYSHQRASGADFDWIVSDIDRCETMLDKIYEDAAVQRGPRYFRFPHIDRGTGAWIVDYDNYPMEDRVHLLTAFADGLNVELGPRPDESAFDKKAKLQKYLCDKGYVQPFKDVTVPWFAHGEITHACDCLYTYSNCDWMLTQRHIGKWPYKSLEDLKRKARTDRYLTAEGGINVVLAHDQAEIVDVTIALVDDMLQSGLTFLEVV